MKSQAESSQGNRTTSFRSCLRVGVIGVGYLGQHHARLYAELSGADLVGIVDLDQPRAQAIAERYGAKAFPNAAALLDQVEAVSIAVPTAGHHAVVKNCLEAGVHVLVEKPIAMTREEAFDLVELAQQRELTLQVGHSERFNPAIRAMRAYICTPKLIECQRLGPFGSRSMDVDVVRDLMIHDLDMILSFNLGAVKEVRAAGVQMLSSTIDVANAWITFENGCTAHLMASRVSANRVRELHLFQPDGYISVDYQTRRGMLFRPCVHAGGESILNTESIQGLDEEPLKLQLKSFLDALSTGTRPVVSGHDGAAALELAHHVLEAIHASSDPSVSFSYERCAS